MAIDDQGIKTLNLNIRRKIINIILLKLKNLCWVGTMEIKSVKKKFIWN